MQALHAKPMLQFFDLDMSLAGCTTWRPTDLCCKALINK